MFIIFSITAGDNASSDVKDKLISCYAQVLTNLVDLGFGPVVLGIILLSALQLVVNLDIELNLGLSARWANRNLGAILSVLLQHIAGGRHVDLGNLSGLDIKLFKLEEVLDEHYW